MKAGNHVEHVTHDVMKSYIHAQYNTVCMYTCIHQCTHGCQQHHIHTMILSLLVIQIISTLSAFEDSGLTGH